MNKEKKLTDEEIVKAYEYCVVQHRDCDGCPYAGWGCPIKGRDVVEAFYRLQDEKQKVVQDYYCERQTCDEQKDIIATQQAEIERLTEENGYLDGCAKQFLADYQNAQVQVDELKEERYYTEQDTAKEILLLILAKGFEKGDYLTDDELKNLFAEKYGVEVE